jgi:phosphoglycolate phosphatase
MRYKAVIFDLDGTLLNTLNDLADAMNDALREAGVVTHPADKYKLMVGDGIRNLVKRALPADRQDLFDKAFATMRENYTKNALNKTKIIDGILKTLQKLREKNIKLAVLTNKDQNFSVRIIEHYFGDKMFELIWGAMLGRPIKPDPVALIELLARLNVKPDDAVFVGDSGVDMDVAAAAGVSSIGVTWGFRSRGELVEHHAGIIIDKPEEILSRLV